MPRRDPYSRTVVRLPERDLSEIVLEVAAPLFERLGPSPTMDDTRAALYLAATFWNANVLASKRWEHPRVKELNALKKHMCGRGAAPGDAATFDRLTELWQEHWLDPRLVESWTCEPDATSGWRFSCTVGMPKGVSAEIPPPAEKRVNIGGRFLDEVTIRLSRNTSLSFPVHRHRGDVSDDGTATVYAMMPSALQLFAEGRLTRVGGEPVEVVVAGRKLGPMVLTEVGCVEENSSHNIAVLVFRPAHSETRVAAAPEGCNPNGVT